MTVALFGGCFNPIHVGHLIVAEAAREVLGAEKVVFVPAGRPPHKDSASLAPAEDRLRMTALAVRDNPCFEVWDYEARSEGPNYTIDTVRAWKRRHGADERLLFLIGADTVHELATWRSVDALFGECRFVPFARPGASMAFPERLAEKVGAERVAEMMDSLVRIPLVDVSSTEIRALVAAGRSVRYLTPDPVAEYIASRGLYRTARGGPAQPHSTMPKANHAKP